MNYMLHILCTQRFFFVLVYILGVHNDADSIKLLILVCLGIVCYRMPDGIYEENCKAYTMCKGGEEVIVQCGPDQAYDTQAKSCGK